jgi:hypothetical protein
MKMSDDLREMMREISDSNRDEVDALVQSIVKIEKSFKNRGSSQSTRRSQIEGEIQNFVDNQQKEEE